MKARAPADTSMPRGLNLMAVGYASEQRLGGPPRLVAGRPPHGDAEVAIDRAAASRLRLAVGGTALVNDIPMAVVGITGGTNLIATQFAFFDLAAVELASGYLSGLASHSWSSMSPKAWMSSRDRQELEASHPDISAYHGRPGWVRSCSSERRRVHRRVFHWSFLHCNSASGHFLRNGRGAGRIATNSNAATWQWDGSSCCRPHRSGRGREMSRTRRSRGSTLLLIDALQQSDDRVGVVSLESPILPGSASSAPA